MRVGPPSVSKVGSNNRSNEPVRSLYWAASDNYSKMINTSPFVQVAAVADVGDNVSSVVFNICKGNNNPTFVSKRVNVYSGRAILLWSPSDAGTYHFFVDLSKTKYSNKLQVGNSVAPSTSQSSAIRNSYYQDSFQPAKK